MREQPIPAVRVERIRAGAALRPFALLGIAEQVAIADGTAPGRRALERLRPEYGWLPAASHGARGWLVELGYRLDETEHSFVATRGDVAPLLPWSGQSSGCFPGP